MTASTTFGFTSTQFDGFQFYDLIGESRDMENPDKTIIGFKSVEINYVKFIRTLKHLGFRRIDINAQTFFVHIHENVIEEVNQKIIIDAFMDHLEGIPSDHPHYKVREKIQSTCIRRLQTLFSDYVLERMKSEEECEFLTDSKDKCYFFYQNGVVEVSKDKINFLQYKDITQFIFKNKILNREFKTIPEQEFIASPWSRFVNNVADNYINEKTGAPNNPTRAENLKRIIGYSLHGYFEGKLKAIVFTDARISDEADGRTGKTLLCKGLGHILNENSHAKTYVEVNGKDFDPSDRFKWQEIGIDTKLIHLNDVKKYFPFDSLFNDIAEGIKRQRKNENPFHVWSKIILSTNRTIKIHGGSSEDRSLEFETADYYSSKFSPEDEFNHWFFRDWDKNQWNEFDNFMINCVQQYLKYGLTKPDTINLMKRKLIEETQPEFITYMESLSIQHLERYSNKATYEAFIENHSDFKKLSQRRFNKYLKRYAEFRPEVKSYVQLESNGQYFFQYEYEVSYLEQEKKKEA